MFVFNQSHAFCVTADSQVYNSLIPSVNDRRQFRPERFPITAPRSGYPNGLLFQFTLLLNFAEESYFLSSSGFPEQAWLLSSALKSFFVFFFVCNANQP